MFYEWQFTSKATAKDLREELAKRSGYRSVKLYFDGQLLADQQLLLHLKLFEAGSRTRAGRLYYCPVIRDAGGHKHARPQVLHTR